MNWADTISILKITKGNNSAKKVGGVTVVNLCTSSSHALYFYQVLWNYLKRFQSYRVDTISIRKISKGNNSAKNVGGVTVVNLCTSSSHALYFYQVLWNYLKLYQSYRWMDDLWFYVLFNNISVISGRWTDDNERLCATEPRLRLRRFRLERGSNSGPLDQ